MVELLLPAMLIFFAEPSFPALDVEELLAPPAGSVICRSVEELDDALTPDRVLVWRHGSAFPAEAWPVLIRFLEAGGSFVYLGGEPFTRPVVGEPGARVITGRTVSLLKELRLNQCRRIDVPVGARYVGRNRTTEAPAWAAILEPRLSDTKDFASEDGAPGSRDGAVIAFERLDWGAPDPSGLVFPKVTPTFCVDRYRGRFAGGRWVFRLLSTPPTDDDMRALCVAASREPVEVLATPSLGCYHEGERPVLQLSVTRPRAQMPIEASFEFELVSPAGETHAFDVRREVARHASFEVPITPAMVEGASDRGVFPPGLYRVRVTVAQAESGRPLGQPFETGFWVRDDALFTSGDRLSFDGYTMLRNGEPEPVIGVTTMSGTVHRKFLFEPNAAVWDDTFRELNACGINFVRTGIWSAFRKISLDPGVVDPAFLRNLEGYYLSARRHGIPILFTFFAFVPESFGGENPYFDPRSIEAQQAYVAAVVGRFVDAKEMLWDLINEPSFSSPDRLWQGRPHGDAHEARAFLAWLEDRYRDAPGGWAAEVRARWRLLPEEPIGLPGDSDFVDRHVMENHRPYRAKEWVRFAQDAFVDWIVAMRQAIRGAGSRASITVGQDEGGLIERPHPLFHANAVDYTSIHSWWFNDSLYADGILAKAADKPLLVSETGVMNREWLSGEAFRPLSESAALLSRKIGYAFGAGAFGVVEWCYEVNPFMASDNEVAIGLKRVDGSYKPEHDVMRRLGRFFTETPRAFTDPKPPRVAIVIPTSDSYAPRARHLPRMKRLIDQFGRRHRVAVQAIPETRCGGGALNGYDLVILPAVTTLANETWAALEGAARRGAVVLGSGHLEADDAGRPASRWGELDRELGAVESVEWSGQRWSVRFPLEAIESERAVDRDEFLRERAIGKGVMLHAALPLEAADSSDLALAVQRYALERAGVEARVRLTPDDPALFSRLLEFPHASLLVIVNEGARPTSVQVEFDGVEAQLVVPARRAFFLARDRQTGTIEMSHTFP